MGLFQSLHLNDRDLSRRTVPIGFLHSAKAQTSTSFPSLLGTLNALLSWRGTGNGMIKTMKDWGLINSVFSGTFQILATPLISLLLPGCTIPSCWLFLRSK